MELASKVEKNTGPCFCSAETCAYSAGKDQETPTIDALYRGERRWT